MEIKFKKIAFIFTACSLLLASCDLERRLAGDQDKVEFTIEEGKEERKPRKKEPEPEIRTEKNYNSVREKFAAQLGVKPADLINGALYDYIDGWIGVPYKYAGNTREGVDCSGFVNAVYKEVYKILLKRSALDIVLQCDLIEKEQLKEGDLVFFDISGKNSHIGLYLINNRFIHASSSKGVMISDLTQAYFVKYWGRAGKVKTGS